MIIDNISRRLTQRFIDYNIIKFDDFDIYIYGLQLLFSTIFKFSGLLILAWLADWFTETIVFVSIFGVLRVNAGGYHSDSYLKCFMMTVILNFSAIIMVKFTPHGDTIYFAICVLCIAIAFIIRYAPVDTPNKPITADEYPVYRRRSVWTIIIVSITILGVYIFKPQFLSFCNIAAAAALFEAATLMPLLNNKTVRLRRKEGA